MAKMDWFQVWLDDKQDMLSTMIRNMASDLDHGYDYFGKSIQEQREMIEGYKAKFESEMEHLKDLTMDRVHHWCYIDLKKRGAI